MKLFIKSFKDYIKENWGNQKYYISDIDQYNNSMTATLDDKIFFLNYVTPDVIIDFGCADGSTLQKIYNINSDIKLIGYDLSINMLEKASNKVPTGEFTSKWNEVLKMIDGYERPLLLLSSVIHEVYSYTNGSEVNSFWKKVFNGNFKYIAIRDMIPSVKLERESVSDDEYNSIKDNIINKKAIEDFENKWGPINSNRRNLIHFLLKYRYYGENWDRELVENYVPLSKETLEKRIPSNYKKLFYESFTLPFLKRKVKEDFNIDLDDNTHIKMLLESN